MKATLWQIESIGDRLVLSGGKDSVGFVCMPRIDSREDGFRWSRAWLEGDFPAGTMLRIYCYVSDDPTMEGVDFSELLRYVVYDDNPIATARSLFGQSISSGQDFLIDGRGRYLWLMVEMGVTTETQPAISALRVQMAADHMTEYLPAIYQSDDFTYRFLSVFDSMMSDMEQKIDSLPALLDPKHTTDDMLRSMAAMMNFTGESNTERLQYLLSVAVESCSTMYSLEGVHNTIEWLTGHRALIIEGKDVDPNRPENGDSETLKRLYGDDPYCFYALLDEDAFPDRQALEIFNQIMSECIPAGVEMRTVLLKNGIQLGWYTYMGVNTVLSDHVAATIGENTSIHFDTMIGGNP